VKSKPRALPEPAAWRRESCGAGGTTRRTRALSLIATDSRGRG
jgi:hypothetical protein